MRLRCKAIWKPCAIACLAAMPLSAHAKTAAPPADTLLGLPLVFQEDFEHGWDRWEIFDSTAWKRTRQNGNTILQVPQLSGYQPPVYGPLNRAIIKDLVVRDFVLEVRVRVTEPYRAHMGGMVFFAYQDPSRFEYAHYAQVATDRTNLVAKVANAPRFTFVNARTSGIPWTRDWQTMRLVRNCGQGTIKAYVDDMIHPVFSADDLNFKDSVFLYDDVKAYTKKDIPPAQQERYEWGRIGLGSFQGILDYDDVRIWAQVKGPPTGIVSGKIFPGRQPGSGARFNLRDRGFRADGRLKP